MKASELIKALERNPEHEVVAWSPSLGGSLDDVYRVVKAQADKFHLDGPWVWVLNFDTTEKSVNELDKWLDGEGELDCE